MKYRALFIILIFLIGSSSYAQKRGSQEIGGGVSFWAKTDNDTSETHLNLDGILGFYFTRDFLFELEPRLTLNFTEDKFDLTGLATFGLSKRFVDMSNLDTNTSSQWARKHERSTAGIYGSIAGGIWAERSDVTNDERVYIGPAMALGLGTRSQLGSLTIMRVKFQYIYLLPTPPVHETAYSMFAINVGFSVITKL